MYLIIENDGVLNRYELKYLMINHWIRKMILSRHCVPAYISKDIL